MFDPKVIQAAIDASMKSSQDLQASLQSGFDPRGASGAMGGPVGEGDIGSIVRQAIDGMAETIRALDSQLAEALEHHQQAQQAQSPTGFDVGAMSGQMRRG